MKENINDLIKSIALGAVNSSKPVILTKGTVVSINPLRINIMGNLLMNCFDLSRNVTDYELEIEGFELETGVPMGGNDSHYHYITGRQKIIVKNALKEGEEVIVARENGGQKYIILDRVK